MLCQPANLPANLPMQQILTAHPPFNFDSTVRSHGWYQLAPIQYDAEQKVLHKPEQLDNGKVILLEVREHSEGIIAASPTQLTPAEHAEVVQKLRWMFLLDSDLSDFYALADHEPRLAHCRSKAYGRLLRSTTLFEDVVRVMMTTNIQWSGTKRLVGKLVEHFGTPLSQATTATTVERAFPIPSAIAASDEVTLRGLGLGYRAPYLLKLARGIASNEIDLEVFRDAQMATDPLRKELLKLPGIGPYAAATLLGILGRYDYIGVDSEAVSSVSRYFYGGQAVGEKEVYAIFGKWGKYKALAYWFWDCSGMQRSPIEQYDAKKSDS